jgi:arsenite-transporting ATPase
MSEAAFDPIGPSPRHLFFTGKGGVGKTSLACAAAIGLAQRGRRVLLVSTDPASNLDEMLGVALSSRPTPVPGASGLEALNIDPVAAAEAYRERVVAPLRGHSTEGEIATIQEELSGACTTEIAAFDEFAGLLAGEGDATRFDHVVFDTAPTGHTLRLLQLPRAWTEFLDTNRRGASCLGPHAALTTRREHFAAAMAALADPARTTVVLVTRADRSALREAARTSGELVALGVRNQRLIVNAVFRASVPDDAVAQALERRGREALDGMPDGLRGLPRSEVPLRTFNMVGLPALRALLAGASDPAAPPTDTTAPPALPPLAVLVDEIAAAPHGLVMVMGKGGVGKTTVAAAIAVELAARGVPVLLSTTDPAAHVASTVDGRLPGLEVARIDPATETRAYVARVLDTKGRHLDAAGRALLEEDLRSPCTEEVAVFHAFARVVASARGRLVVLDTAPTGHTLLLLDATGAYHRDVLRGVDPTAASRLITPLMRLRDPAYTRVLLVTLPEVTPVSEAAQLQTDLRRAGVEPAAWVINASLGAAGTRDPLLAGRVAAEAHQVRRVVSLARRAMIVPWSPEEPVGVERLRRLVADGGAHGSRFDPGHASADVRSAAPRRQTP